jgi:hypothetical protein
MPIFEIFDSWLTAKVASMGVIRERRRTERCTEILSVDMAGGQGSDLPVTGARALRPWERRECLDHVVLFGEGHLRHVLKIYAGYYNKVRTHLSLDKYVPNRRCR